MSEDQGSTLDVYVCAVCKTRAHRRRRQRHEPPRRQKRMQHLLLPPESDGAALPSATKGDSSNAWAAGALLCFTSATANAAAEAVVSKQATSMADYHRHHHHYANALSLQAPSPGFGTAAETQMSIPLATPERGGAVTELPTRFSRLLAGRSAGAASRPNRLEQRRRKQSIPRCLDLLDGLQAETMPSAAGAGKCKGRAGQGNQVGVHANVGIGIGSSSNSSSNSNSSSSSSSSGGYGGGGGGGWTVSNGSDDNCGKSILHLLSTTPDLLLIC